MTLNPVPTCEVCGSETKRIASRGGKGRYRCMKFGCPNKKWYIRGSRKVESGRG